MQKDDMSAFKVYAVARVPLCVPIWAASREAATTALRAMLDAGEVEIWDYEAEAALEGDTVTITAVSKDPNGYPEECANPTDSIGCTFDHDHKAEPEKCEFHN